ncbi:hypothetical protein OSTOST_02780 [Ostertagia ostertagi]
MAMFGKQRTVLCRSQRAEAAATGAAAGQERASPSRATRRRSSSAGPPIRRPITHPPRVTRPGRNSITALRAP